MVDWGKIVAEKDAEINRLDQMRSITVTADVDERSANARDVVADLQKRYMPNLLQQMRAEDMDKVIQAVALIRPGPAGCGMKDSYIRRAHGSEEPTKAAARASNSAILHSATRLAGRSA